MRAVFVSTCVYVGGHCGAVCVFIVEICTSYCQVGLSVGVTEATQVWLGKGLALWCDGAVGAQTVISTLPTRGQLGKRWPYTAFTWVLGTQTQVLRFAQAFCPLSHPPALSFDF